VSNWTDRIGAKPMRHDPVEVPGTEGMWTAPVFATKDNLPGNAPMGVVAFCDDDPNGEYWKGNNEWTRLLRAELRGDETEPPEGAVIGENEVYDWEQDEDDF